MRRPAAMIFLLLAGLGLLALGWLWFTEAFVKVPERVRVGFQGEARQNPYLAAERLLDRLGLEVRSVERLAAGESLPPADGTLLLPGSRLGLGQELSLALAGWVERGGHLIATVPDQDGGAGAGDYLLEALKIRVVRRQAAPAASPAEAEAGASAPGMEDAEESEERREKEGDGEEAQPISIELPAGERALKVSAPAVEELVAEEVAGGPSAGLRVAGRVHAFLLQYRVGAGLLTLLASSSFCTNGSIGEWDNAALVWRLAAWEGRSGPVTLVRGSDVPSLLLLVARHGWTVLASAGLLLLLWLWSRAWRIGPVQQLPPPVRRSIMEHVRATGWYYWRQGPRDRLFEAVAGEVRNRAARRTPDWLRLTAAEQHRRIAALTGLPVEEVEQTMDRRAARTRAGFTHAVSRLERIARTL